MDYVKVRKKTIDNAITNQNEFRSDNGDNVDGQKQETWVEFADRILEQYERNERTKNNEQSNGNNESINNSIKYSKELDNSSFSYDNQGRKLSKQQQEYFKDSKARDENGNLEKRYIWNIW